MNILTDALPKTVDVNGKRVPIRTDFRDCLRVILAFEDNNLTQNEKYIIMLSNLYPTIPQNIPAAIRAAGIFLDGGHEPKESDGVRLYSFTKDANFIFAAFKQTHGIDLQRESLHWWQFMALFMDLGSDTTFCNLTSLRKRVKSGKATKEEIRAAREMGDAFDVPEVDDRTLEEREIEAAYMAAVEKAKNANH